MKIRFSSQKEQQPTVDGGLKVLYAPGKRTAFRLRWYLIVLLVVSPFLWLLYTLLQNLYAIEAPARVHVNLSEIRALQPGIVQALEVAAGDRVEPGSLLLRVSNNELEQRHRQLLADVAQGTAEGESALATPRRELLHSFIRRAEERAAVITQLHSDKAATSAELQQALNELELRQQDLLAFENAEQERRQVPLGQRGDLRRQQQELALVQERISQLRVTSDTHGRVIDTAVAMGESVGPGTPLLRIQPDTPARIFVYLEPQHARQAKVGQPLKIQLPDKSWMKASVVAEPTQINRLPAELRSPLSTAEQVLIVEVQTEAALPAPWQLANLYLQARFKRFGF